MTRTEAKQLLRDMGVDHIKAVGHTAEGLLEKLANDLLHGSFNNGREVIKQKYKYDGAWEFHTELVKALNNLRKEES